MKEEHIDTLTLRKIKRLVRRLSGTSWFGNRCRHLSTPEISDQISHASPDVSSKMEHPAYTMAAACAGTGILSYARHGSSRNLVGGLVLGGIYGFAGKLVHENKDWGLESAAAASAVVVAISLPRAIKYPRPVPVAGATLGFLALAYYSKKWSDFYL